MIARLESNDILTQVSGDGRGDEDVVAVFFEWQFLK